MEKQIQNWLERGMIDPGQAEIMLRESLSFEKQKRAGRFIATISTIGSVLIGAGAILFIASNWEAIPNAIRIGILSLITFLAYGLGYWLRYGKKQLPKTGSALIFLGALLFGATIMLIAQIYNVNANAHWLLLIWLAGSIPAAIGFRNVPIVVLCAFMLNTWLDLFIFRDAEPGEGTVFVFPVIHSLMGMLLFGLSGVLITRSYEKIGNAIRFSGQMIALLSLYLLSYRFFSGKLDHKWFDGLSFEGLPPQTQTILMLVGGIAILLNVGALIRNFMEKKKDAWQFAIPVLASGFVMTFFLYPPGGNQYTIAFNLFFALLVFGLIWQGYRSANIKQVNLGLFWTSAFIITKYFDAFWDLMPRSLFFLVGGTVLVTGGILVERKRRKLQLHFEQERIGS